MSLLYRRLRGSSVSGREEGLSEPQRTGEVKKLLQHPSSVYVSREHGLFLSLRLGHTQRTTTATRCPPRPTLTPSGWTDLSDGHGTGVPRDCVWEGRCPRDVSIRSTGYLHPWEEDGTVREKEDLSCPSTRTGVLLKSFHD